MRAKFKTLEELPINYICCERTKEQILELIDLGEFVILNLSTFQHNWHCSFCGRKDLYKVLSSSVGLVPIEAIHLDEGSNN